MLPATKRDDMRREMAMETVLRHIDAGVENWEECCGPVMEQYGITPAAVVSVLRRRAFWLMIPTPVFLLAAVILQNNALALAAHHVVACNLAAMMVVGAYYSAVYVAHEKRCRLNGTMAMLTGSLIGLVVYRAVFELFITHLPLYLLPSCFDFITTILLGLFLIAPPFLLYGRLVELPGN